MAKQIKMAKRIKYVDFGIPDAKSFFGLIVLPNVLFFEQSPTVQFGLNAVWALWHLHEWHWHDNYPNQNTQNNSLYDAFVQRLCQECPELKYLRDIADVVKHRGTARASISVGNLSEQQGRGGAGGYSVPGGGYGVGQLAYADGTPRLRVSFDDGSDPVWF